MGPERVNGKDNRFEQTLKKLEKNKIVLNPNDSNNFMAMAIGDQVFII